MAERGILMADRLAQGCAIGTKLVTRRPITRALSTVCGYVGRLVTVAWPNLEFANAWTDPGFSDEAGEHDFGYLHVPYRPEVSDQRVYRVRSRIEPGDVLYVRECWAPMDADYQWVPWKGGDEPWPHVAYRAAGPMFNGDRVEVHPPRWYPSIHMPRWAARTWLRVTNVRAERLQDMDEHDARLEGVVCDLHPDDHPDCLCLVALTRFPELWDDHYFGGPYAWGRNPWVWRWAFERIAGGDL